MPPKSKDQRDMSPRPLQVAFPNDPGWKPFGDRLNFLSPERQHLETGKLKILPPDRPEKRQPKAK